ncbi:tetratricopeptide repeat protein [Seonamhaeicola sp. ML3]|uniref:tetratricopeptide repeat protein n=1 Tax=Seonamhaeicola sp. ML3 TaxID=2937786 RepID=UPI0020107A69|nr:tetratricopeptide repeat protein [Seonamhaeicola sp. ML3]
MKRLLLLLLTLCVSVSFAQDKKDKEQLLALKKANNYVYQGNKLIEDDFISSEMAYRKALSENNNSVEAQYNLGNAYYQEGNFEEALYRHQKAATNAKTKAEKHKAFHNIGNILMQNKKCREAVEAFKSALRNDPTDDETRYNLALAKDCAKDEQENKDQNQDDKNNEQEKDNENQEDKDDKNKENDDKEGDNKNDKENEDKGEEKDKEGDKDEDKDGKPNDEKDDKGKPEDQKDGKEKSPPKPQQGKMSPQQIKNLLEAMNNQEQKVQEKMNAEKQKGIKVKTDKDW